ncbi:MAG: GDP-mannose 4,6-dehydratase [Candidatus Margulisiibacteriota bacterium]|nr:MAG: GDP-mannose 4,6-dehydratase [Candidatus Margulisbacteria bacterium GWD2_39_127]OGI04005.1 MAG: GDP-mannose 4,6-dehydratase [Candidatus Margulisbacteria bacterium GWF2_38_17]OGI06528.1 MAG: GDP-mannose 4,6-dehydratase [Candidatus Margulisbacteria bacterium GWE2_39_32]PZM83217.1 MAG: GDP-mannose 4,6-dehydratase [Candidatus Margulisiibacteriota bacterium]HAR62478.1 GDP-mannose 4,6-dehydratase [Candidatus Margulisiibacteriota bacterium]
MKKKAIITGINGQDGSYLAELLLAKGYEVHGIVRRSSLENDKKLVNLKNSMDKIELHHCSMEDHLSLYKLISHIIPDECYHLAASSFVSYLFDDELSIVNTNFNATHYLLSSIKELVPNCRFYFAGSSEMFGEPETSPQDEECRFNPRSIYGISKLASYYVTKNYREQYGLYCCTGITYNHESPRRGHSFVTRKITSGVAKIVMGKARKLELGNLDTVRDWGYAPDYAQAMWLMLNNPLGPKDYVISTGIGHTVKNFLDVAFSLKGLDYRDYVEVNQKYFRPAEKKCLIGNSSLIKEELGWMPTKKFEDIITDMVLGDIDLLSNNVQECG